MGQVQAPTSVSLLQSPFRCLRRYGPCRGDRRHGAHTEDGNAVPDALPDNPGEVFADSAYRGNHLGDAVRAKGGRPRIVATAVGARRGRKLDAWNQPIHRICTRIEKIFGTCSRMRWRGLAKAAVQIRRTAIAYSMKHSLMVASSPHR